MTVIDGGCPVLRADSPCPDRPIAAHLSILDATTGAIVGTVDSGSDGHFSVALHPGSYVLRPENAAGAPPRRSGVTTVTVEAGHYTPVTIRFDSGIR
jgi:hypothetical protein